MSGKQGKKSTPTVTDKKRKEKEAEKVGEDEPSRCAAKEAASFCRQSKIVNLVSCHTIRSSPDHKKRRGEEYGELILEKRGEIWDEIAETGSTACSSPRFHDERLKREKWQRGSRGGGMPVKRACKCMRWQGPPLLCLFAFCLLPHSASINRMQYTEYSVQRCWIMEAKSRTRHGRF